MPLSLIYCGGSQTPRRFLSLASCGPKDLQGIGEEPEEMLSKNSVAWRLGTDDCEDGPLKVEQVSQLNAGHGFPVADIERLSIGLGFALDRKRYLVRDESKEFLRNRAVVEVRALAGDLEEIEKTLDLVRTRLGVVIFKNTYWHTGMPNPVNRHLENLDAALANLASFRNFLFIMAREKLLSMREMPDKRRLRDERLRIVCFFIFDFWREHGRNLSYTTDPDKSGRSGALVDFVNDVIACISDPPGRLSGEAIKSEIEYFKARRDRNAAR